jgi:hypothetical protein
MRFFALTALPLLAACWWRSDPAPAAPILPEVVRLVPDTASYRVIEHRRTEQTVNDRPLVIRQTRTTWLTATLTALDSGLTATWTLDSTAITGPFTDTVGTATHAAAGTIFRAGLDQNGRVTSIHADRTSAAPIAHVAELLAGFFPVADGGARPGATSVDTTEILTGWSTLLRGPSINSRTVAADWTTWAGVPALRISTESRYTLAGSGRLSERFEVTIEGSGRRYADQYVDWQGRYLGGTAADTADLEARVAGIGLVIPGRVMRVDTVEARR